MGTAMRDACAPRRDPGQRAIGLRHVFKGRAKGTDLAQMAHSGGSRSLDEEVFFMNQPKSELRTGLLALAEVALIDLPAAVNAARFQSRD